MTDHEAAADHRGQRQQHDAAEAEPEAVQSQIIQTL